MPPLPPIYLGRRTAAVNSNHLRAAADQTLLA